jgi:hypothetical protein
MVEAEKLDPINMPKISLSEIDPPFYAHMLAGAMAGSICWFSTYPYDVVKTLIQSDDFENP